MRQPTRTETNRQPVASPQPAPPREEQAQGTLAEVRVGDGDEITIMPIQTNKTFRMTVAAMSGAGKSVWTAKFLRLWRVEHPWDPDKAARHEKRPKAPAEDDESSEDEEREARRVRGTERIFMFRFAEHDPAYKDIPGVQNVRVDEEFISNPLPYSKLRNSVCVFDDVEALTGAALKSVLTLRDQIFKCGRKDNISIISIIHQMLDREATKTTWGESELVTLFPRADTSAVRRLLEYKFFMNKENVDTILSQHTRWVVLKRSHPRCIITPRAVISIQ